MMIMIIMDILMMMIIIITIIVTKCLQTELDYGSLLCFGFNPLGMKIMMIMIILMIILLILIIITFCRLNLTTALSSVLDSTLLAGRANPVYSPFFLQVYLFLDPIASLTSLG